MKQGFICVPSTAKDLSSMRCFIPVDVDFLTPTPALAAVDDPRDDDDKDDDKITTITS